MNGGDSAESVALGEAAKPDSSEETDVLDSSEAGGLLVRGGALRFAGYVCMLALSVLMAAVLTRHLGVARFGQYTTVMSLVAMVAAVTDAGMSNIGTREYSVLRGDERDAMLRHLLGLRVVLTLVGVAVSTAFAVAAGYDLALLVGTLTASLATVALVFQHTLSIPLTTDLRLGVVSALELTRQAAWVSGIVALAAIGAGVFPLLSVPLFVNVLMIVPTALLVRGRISARMVVAPRAWPPLLRATIIFSLATAVGTIYIYATQILTSLVTTHHQSGLFAVSFRVVAVSATVPGLLASVALPVLSRAARDDLDRLAYGLQRIFDVSLVGGVGAALMLSAGAAAVVAVIAGPAYSAAADVLQVQAFALVASFLAAGWSFALLALGQHRGLLAANAAALLVSVALTVVLAAADGAQGAAIATICGEVTLAASTLVALSWKQRRFRPPPRIIPRVVLSAAIAATLAFGLQLPAGIRPLVAGAAYAAAILVTRAAPHELKELLAWRQTRR